MEIGTVRLINIDNEMRTSYLDYSMSVIVQRALPDVRDGMKPVQRRVLYAMHEMGLRHSSRHRKSAGIVGEVLKNFHPHSDTAVYDALARMAQPWSLRYPLVDGQGNFGSVDGDAPAAMRYTEARMASITEELLRDIDKNTVDFIPNYDDSMMQPSVLPARLPALLLNGAVITIGLVGGFIFGVYLQNVSAGAYVSTLTLVTGLPEVLISVVKAMTFGLIAGLVGCYRGLTVAGGAKGVGTAVNETLVLCVIALFAVNVVLTTIGVRFGTGN